MAYTSHKQYFTEHIHIDNMNEITGFDEDIDDDGDADAKGDGESVRSSNTTGSSGLLDQMVLKKFWFVVF